ncbi:PREDICTED: disease resistance-like protein CSA1 [Camelina sativa]|uniref:Disease resistance-like protein CSA1 n=1 Tax=Camelina sativa TaxID=90675 RepID=A0ABM0Y2P9_CAMSA|nr:PREDICTED: disease resistance-like protein CSA1 [Camelina sativa]XP_010494543.1 PREDICTED: disease resistance-like protein CSA1 [Camelina sativa]XP_010494544.1 PREDICTED: disease resistance-like protein CSA1 [Camelina sativa]
MGAAFSQAGDRRPQVFLNYRKEELRHTFIKRLLTELQRNNVNYFIDDKAQKGKPITDLFEKIEESAIALAIFSKWYSESKWCLDELVRMKEGVEAGELVVIPIFVNVTPSEVKNFNGVFGVTFQKLRNKYGKVQIQKWKEAVEYIAGISGMVWNDRYPDYGFTHPCSLSDDVLVMRTTREVKKELLRRDPNYGKTEHVGSGVTLFVSAMLAFFCGIFLPKLFLADGNLRFAASWLVGFLVFYKAFQIKTTKCDHIITSLDTLRKMWYYYRTPKNVDKRNSKIRKR